MTRFVPRFFLFGLILIALTLVFAPGAALAQGADNPLRVEVDRTELGLDESLVLTIMVNDLGDTPTLPALDGFDIVAQSTRSQINILNGARIFTSSYQYRLKPKRVGDLLIGPVTLYANGRSHSSEPIIITVSPGRSTAPAGGARAADEKPAVFDGQDFFVEAVVDNVTPYQGEQILHTLRFYQAKEVAQEPRYRGPSFTGFWHGEDVNSVQYMTEAAGRDYRVTELQTAIVPTVVDDLTIDPAGLEIPGGFFTRYQYLTTQPVDVQVKPLPEGAPNGFAGAVGQFQIVADVDKRQINANDVVTLRMEVSGQGNIDTMSDVELPDSSDWRVFPEAAEVQSEIVDGKLTGSRSTRWVLTPTSSGSLQIPGLTFSYFNPETAAYETITTEPIEVEVTGAAGVNAMPARLAVAESEAAVTAPTLRPIKATDAPLKRASAPLVARTEFWLLWLIPVGLVAGQLIWQRRQQYLLDSRATRRSQQAAHKANLALAELVASGGGDKGIHSVLCTYLAEKLDRSVIGLTQAELADVLIKAGVRAQLAERVCELLEASETSRYAPTGSLYPSSVAVLEAKRLIDDLERAFVV